MQVEILSKATHQGHLESVIKKFFPSENVTTNVKRGHNIINPISGHLLEIDLFVPSLSLAFEFQDSYHYATAWFSHTELADIKQKDSIKQEVINRKEITLVYVPCWWDAQPESLLASIKFQRPDLQKETNYIINEEDNLMPLNPPFGFFDNFSVPDVGEVTLASFLTSFGDLDLDNQAWWLGEKYDGVRCLWHPGHQTLYSRRGLAISLLHCFVPPPSTTSFFDGEIWFGRGNFFEAQKITGLSENVNWSLLRIVAFDDPTPDFQNDPFEKRYERLFSLNIEHFFEIAVRLAVNSKTNIKKILKNTLEKQGEGVMLRKHSSVYEHGRSSVLYKIKATRSDTEALVTRVTDELVYLQMASGLELEIPFKDSQSEQLPRKGDVVTIKFDYFSKKSQPVNPVISRLRQDLSWDDVLRDFSNSSKFEKEKEKDKQNNRIAGSKGETQQERIRQFFVDFSTSRNFDPFVPAHWYSFSRSDIITDHNNKVLESLGLVKALMLAFPEVQFDPVKFSSEKNPTSYWKELVNRKKYFDDFATRFGFDYRIADNWYPRSIARKLYEERPALLNYYNGNYVDAILHVYPDIGLQKRKFQTNEQKGHWEEEKNRKEFFDKIASENSMDPLVASNWYSFPKEEIMNHKGATSVLSFYGHNVIRALLSLYPDIGLMREKFLEQPITHWHSEANRREFFENFALELGFDSLAPENWYKIRRHLITSRHGGSAVLKHHQGSYVKALIDLYPDVEFNIHGFNNPPSAHWVQEENRKTFFDDFANSNEFDALIPDNWYSFNRQDISCTPGGSRVLQFYHGNLFEALSKLYPEVKFDKFKFPVLPKGYWEIQKNRKIFFDKYASKHNFDPLVGANWLDKELDLMKSKGILSILNHFKGNLKQALSDVYPSLTFQPRVNDWRKLETRRKCFDEFAKERDFSPLIAANWYPISYSKLTEDKKMKKLLSFYGCNSYKALCDVYPEVSFEPGKFSIRRGKFWSDEHNKRVALDEYALANNFDPLKEENWYRAQKEQFNMKGVRKAVLGYPTFLHAIQAAYPELNFKKFMYNN